MNHKENEIELTALFVNIVVSQTRLKLASQGTADTEYESDPVYCFYFCIYFFFPSTKRKKSPKPSLLTHFSPAYATI